MSIKKGTIATKVAMDKLQPFTKKIPDTEKAPFSGGSKFRNGDTIMARITPCLENGKTAFVDILGEDEIAFGSTEFIVMRAKEGVSDPQFIYYLATSPSFRNIAIKSMVGSSGRQRVQQTVLDELVLSVPPLEEQKKISSLLCVLDQKIALNNEINDNLQQQAELLYHKRFETVNRDKLPVGWRIVRLGDVATISKKSFNPAKEPEMMLEHYSIPLLMRHISLYLSHRLRLRATSLSSMTLLYDFQAESNNKACLETLLFNSECRLLNRVYSL